MHDCIIRRGPQVKKTKKQKNNIVDSIRKIAATAKPNETDRSRNFRQSKF